MGDAATFFPTMQPIERIIKWPVEQMRLLFEATGQFVDKNWNRPVWILAAFLFCSALYGVAFYKKVDATYQSFVRELDDAIAAKAEWEDAIANSTAVEALQEQDYAISSARADILLDLVRTECHCVGRDRLQSLRSKIADLQPKVGDLKSHLAGTKYYASEAAFLNEDRELEIDLLSDIEASLPIIDTEMNDLLLGNIEAWSKDVDKSGEADVKRTQKLHSQTAAIESHTRLLQAFDEKEKSKVLETRSRIFVFNVESLIPTISLLYCGGFVATVALSIWKLRRRRNKSAH